MTATIDRDEIVPLSVDAPEPEPDTSGAPTCLVCGKALTYAGRGRKPIYCEDHKPGRSAGKPAATGGRQSKDDKLRKELTSTLALMGMGLMAVNQYDGLVVIDRSGDTVDALMTVAEHNPRVRKALEQMLEVSVWAALGTAIAGIGVPIAVNHGLLPLPQEAVEKQFLSPETCASMERMRAAKEPPNGPWNNTRTDEAPARPTVVPDPKDW